MNPLRPFFFLATIFLAYAPLQGNASTSIDLQLQSLSGQGWSIEGVEFSLGSLNSPTQPFKLSIRRLSLSEPFQQLSFLDINCPSLQITSEQLLCPQGYARLQSNQSDILSVFFSLTLTNNSVSIRLTSQTNLLTSQLILDLTWEDSWWQLNAKADNLILSNMRTLGAVDVTQLDGILDLQGKLAGTSDQITDLELFLNVRQLNLNTKDARVATEQLAVTADIKAMRSIVSDWSVISDIRFNQGLLYLQPIYLEIRDDPLRLATRLHWSSQLTQLNIEYIDLRHPGAGRLQGKARLVLGSKPLIQHLQAYLLSSDLKQLYTAYVKPFIEATPWAETQVAGQASVQLQMDNDQLSQLSTQFEALSFNDPEGRFGLVGGQGYIDWHQQSLMRSSRLLWQSAQLFSIPFGAADVQVTHNLDRLVIAEKTGIPILDGQFVIHQFSIDDLQKNHPKFRFKGELRPISLEKLSKIFDWPQLTGSLSGNIPRISYHQGELKIEGQLRARIFEGEVVINRLKIAGLLGALPRLTADYQLKHLNMSLLTRKFGFGAIEGELEGYIRDLYLENWHPVSFDAWLGTPENDDSRHRISQKAVENITSLGGGGASDVISRSVLRFFDSFSYDRIGIGCTLNQGICQMKGVTPGRGGYYMIKGSGLPRIDMIGYNPRINWQELLQRLERINTADDAIVE